MSRTKDEQFLHDWVIRKIKERWAREYKEVHINPGDERNYAVAGLYPDVVFVNYGQVVMVVEVETPSTVSETEVEEWKSLSDLGARLVVAVPKELQARARELCWNHGLAAKVKVGSYSVEFAL